MFTSPNSRDWMMRSRRLGFVDGMSKIKSKKMKVWLKCLRGKRDHLVSLYVDAE
jgi:hypothetical protein